MKFKNFFKILLSLFMGGFLVVYSLHDVSLDVILGHCKQANYSWIVLALFFGALSHVSRAYRWKYLLEPIGHKPDFVNSILAVLVSYLVNLALPRAGEVSRATVMKKYDNIPFEKAFGTIVAERISDVLMLLVILFITLILQFEFIVGVLSKKDFDPVKILSILMLVLVFSFIINKFINKFTLDFFLKIKRFFLGLLEGVLSIFKMKSKWMYVLHTIFIWLMYVLMFWSTTHAIYGLEVSFDAVLVGFIAGSLSMVLTNGGVGSYPIAVANAFFIFGVNFELSSAFGWLMWSTQTLMVVIFGVLAFLFLPNYNRLNNRT